MSRTTKKSAPSPTPYTPSDREVQAARRVMERRALTAPPPSFNIEVAAPNCVNISADHQDPAINYFLLADAFGTGDYELADGLLKQLAGASRLGKTVTKQELDFMLCLVRGLNPRDETEALLACQMAAIHNATMVAASRLNRVETVPQQDSASNMLNKLARTFASQVEALKKYRSAGEQTIKVQHVTVNDGGQAIVGNVSRGGGGTDKNGGQPHEPCAANECSPALLGHEQTLPMPMPSAGSQGLDGVPVSRSTRRSAKGEG